jgi:hypothetical protein
LLGFCDKVKFDPWPEPPPVEVFEANQDWSDRQKVPPRQCRKSDAGGREVFSADFADDADEGKEICAICVICGFPIPHLNGSFPVFILGWTIGAISVECDGMTSLLECGNTLPLSSTRHVASDQSADVSAHSKAALRRAMGRGAHARGWAMTEI